MTKSSLILVCFILLSKIGSNSAQFSGFGFGPSEDESNESEPPREPGLKIRLTRKALTYASSLGGHVLEKEIKEIKFPKIRAKINDGPGHGEVTMSNILIQNFKSPDFDYELSPPNNFVWKAKGGYVQVKSDWNAWYKMLFKMSFSGYVLAAASDVDIYINATARMNNESLPEFQVMSCGVTLNDLQVKIGGGFVPSLVNFFRGMISSKLKNLVESQLCVAVEGVLIKFANKKILQLPKVIPLEQGFYLNYAMTEDPIITEDYIESRLFAEVTYKGESTPLEPTPLPDIPTPANASRMIYVWGTDFMVNSFLYSAHHHNFMKFALTKETAPGVKDYLRTSCFLTCIGFLIPEIGEEHPDSFVDVLMQTVTAPQVIVQPSGAKMNTTITADLFLNPWNVTMTHMVRLEIDFAGSVELSMKGHSLVGNFTVEELDCRVVQSWVGPIQPDALDLIEELARPYIQQMLNGYLTRGLPIPTVENIRLISPEIEFLDRNVQIDTNMAYKDIFEYRLIKSKASSTMSPGVGFA